MTRSRLLPSLIFLAACGGDGGSTTPVGPGALVLAKAAPSGDAQGGTVGNALAAPLRVLATRDGVPEAGAIVTFTVGAASGSVVPLLDTTDVDGIASTTWTLGTLAGGMSITASAAGASGPVLHFGATAAPGPVDTLLFQSGGSQAQEKGLTFGQPIVVRVTDLFGNGLAGVTVDWAILSGPGGVSVPSSVTQADGRASVIAFAGDSAGAITLSATVVALPTQAVHVGLTVVDSSFVIGISNNFFSPAHDTIPVGSAVKWVWLAGPHDIAPQGGPVSFQGSPAQDAGATFGPVLFSVAGTYTYECTIHAQMAGTIVVQ